MDYEIVIYDDLLIILGLLRGKIINQVHGNCPIVYDRSSDSSHSYQH